jgi:hypothetical protein
MSRSAIVDAVFVGLSGRPDGGLGQFRSMLQALLSWSRFDPYYFDKMKKLDRAAAGRSLEHLKQLQEIRDAKLIEERQRREAIAATNRKPSRLLTELRTEFLDLYANKLPRPARGYALEKLLRDLAKIDELECTDPFRVHGEQLDGAIKFDGEHYLVEAKWQEKAASNEPLYHFAQKVEGRMYGRGIFVSIQGFSEQAVLSLIRGKALRTMLIDGEDLVLVLEGQLTFAKMLDKKVKAAQVSGLIYVHPITELEKLHG